MKIKAKSYLQIVLLDNLNVCENIITFGTAKRFNLKTDSTIIKDFQQLGTRSALCMLIWRYMDKFVLKLTEK